MIVHPPYLQQGATIGITCPSSHIPKQQIDFAASVLEQQGYKVLLGNTASREHFYFAGHDEERLNDLQDMLDNPEIDAILMGRGGYGMSRIIDRIDFSQFVQRPKWICGFSDIVVLHSHIQRLFGIATLHSPMCNAFKPDMLDTAHLRSFYDALSGLPLQYNVHKSPYNRNGEATALLTGGNLAILAHLTGSVSDIDTDGKILFLEDIGEYLYNIDRMLLQLKRAGKLDNLSGLILGGFTDLQDTQRPFGQTIEEIIWDKVKEYCYPVCFGFPCGHQDVNYTLTLGMNHKLSVTDAGAKLELIKE